MVRKMKQKGQKQAKTVKKSGCVVVAVDNKKKDIENELLCSDSKNNVSIDSGEAVSQNGIVATPTLSQTTTTPILKFHPSSLKLFQTIVQTFRENKKTEYTISGFRSVLALYYGFHERNISPRINLLKSLGVIKVTARSKAVPYGRVFLYLPRLLELSDSDWLDDYLREKEKREKEQIASEANAFLEEKAIVIKDEEKKEFF